MDTTVENIGRLPELMPVSDVNLYNASADAGIPEIPDVLEICDGARARVQHLLAAIALEELLSDISNNGSEDTSPEISENYEIVRYIRSKLRHHLFSITANARQVYPPSITKNLEQIKEERDFYKEIPFSSIYEVFKGGKERTFWSNFVMKIFEEYYENNTEQRIFLDLAVGGGLDIENFLDGDFNMVGNDISRPFLEQTRNRLREKGHNTKLIQSDWRELSGNHGEEQYDGTYLLGNSLTYLAERRDQEKALREIWKILKKDAIFIFDVRNYDYILDERERILPDPIVNFHFMYGSCYTGDQVLCYPTIITNKQVLFEYLYPRDKLKAHLSLYPFREQALDGLITSNGFEIVGKKYDCTPGMTTEKEGHYDFCLYIVRKV